MTHRNKTLPHLLFSILPRWFGDAELGTVLVVQLCRRISTADLRNFEMTALFNLGKAKLGTAFVWMYWLQLLKTISSWHFRAYMYSFWRKNVAEEIPSPCVFSQGAVNQPRQWHSNRDCPDHTGTVHTRQHPTFKPWSKHVWENHSNVQLGH